MSKLSNRLRSLRTVPANVGSLMQACEDAARALDACEVALKADGGAYEALRELGVTTRELPGMEHCDKRRKDALEMLEHDQ